MISLKHFFSIIIKICPQTEVMNLGGEGLRSHESGKFPLKKTQVAHKYNLDVCLEMLLKMPLLFNSSLRKSQWLGRASTHIPLTIAGILPALV